VSSPDVSVVIPTRDRVDRLRLALRAALAQAEVALEVVVVDDASTDETRSAVEATADPRVRYVRRDGRGGVSASRNDGIETAGGTWIAFLDDDDLWAPTKLSRQLAAARISERGWAYAGEVVIDAELHVLGGAPPAPPEEVVRMLERYNAVPAGASNVIVAADMLSRAGGFDPSLTNAEDWDLWIRLARLGPPAWVRDGLVAITVHPGNASRNMPGMLDAIEIVAARYGVPLDRARHLRWAAWTSMLDGRRAEAAGYYLRAARAGDPTSIARAAAALATPRLASRRARAATDAGRWLEEASAWIRTFATP
jgi:glycosyltransferase involved in cell wall biosynthesis